MTISPAQYQTYLEAKRNFEFHSEILGDLIHEVVWAVYQTQQDIGKAPYKGKHVYWVSEYEMSNYDTWDIGTNFICFRGTDRYNESFSFDLPRDFFFVEDALTTWISSIPTLIKLSEEEAKKQQIEALKARIAKDGELLEKLEQAIT